MEAPASVLTHQNAGPTGSNIKLCRSPHRGRYDGLARDKLRRDCKMREVTAIPGLGTTGLIYRIHRPISGREYEKGEPQTDGYSQEVGPRSQRVVSKWWIDLVWNVLL